MFRGCSDLSVHFIGCVYSSFIFRRYPVHFVDFGLPPSISDSGLYLSALWLWFISVHLVASGLYPSILDLKFSSFWDDPSTLWTLFYIRPCWTSNSHPLGMNRPLCGLVLYPSMLDFKFSNSWDDPSILDFKFSSSWDDPSTLWTCSISIHIGLQILILLGWPVHFVDLFYIRPYWTSNSHPFGMTHPLCGLVLYSSILDFKFSSFWDDPSTLWTLCNLSIHNKNPCGKSKLHLNILLKRKCVCREKYLPPWA